MTTLPVFDYLEELDCFLINPVFSNVVCQLHLNEWHPAVWVGRYFTMDNDFGEHWFEDWDEREALRERAEKLGYSYEQLPLSFPGRKRRPMPQRRPAKTFLDGRTEIASTEFRNAV
jgi:hypothetical protein